MIGLPPFLGFVGKESLYEAVLHAPKSAVLLITLSVLSSMAFFVVVGLVVFRTFFGEKQETPKHPHEAPWTMWLGPLCLGSLSLITGLACGYVGHYLVGPAADAILHKHTELHLALWHGFNLPLAMSALALAGGAVVYVQRERIFALHDRLFPPVSGKNAAEALPASAEEPSSPPTTPEETLAVRFFDTAAPLPEPFVPIHGVRIADAFAGERGVKVD